MNKKNVVLKNKKLGMVSICGLNLIPGPNLVSKENFDKLCKHPIGKLWLDNDVLESGVEVEKSKTDNPIEGMNVSDASAFIAECNDVKMLEAIEEIEERAGVKKALSKRFKELEEALSDDSKDGDK